MSEENAPLGPFPFVLVLDSDANEAGRFLVHEGENWVGIPIEEEGYEPQVDLEAFDKLGAVSRRHARIIREGEQVTIEHIGKTNPTRINDVVLSPGEKRIVQHGDHIVFAQEVHARFVVEEIPATP